MSTFNFLNNCVGWPAHDVHASGGLVDMIDRARDITRNTFERHVNRAELTRLEASLGYDVRFRMKDDYHVRYRRSVLHGNPVYFFEHSAIEYVFHQSH